jgi:NADH:ubiquinone oxidoreductase subunit D
MRQSVRIMKQCVERLLGKDRAGPGVVDRRQGRRRRAREMKPRWKR